MAQTATLKWFAPTRLVQVMAYAPTEGVRVELATLDIPAMFPCSHVNTGVAPMDRVLLRTLIHSANATRVGQVHDATSQNCSVRITAMDMVHAWMAFVLAVHRSRAAPVKGSAL